MVGFTDGEVVGSEVVGQPETVIVTWGSEMVGDVVGSEVVSMVFGDVVGSEVVGEVVGSEVVSKVVGYEVVGEVDGEALAARWWSPSGGGQCRRRYSGVQGGG